MANLRLIFRFIGLSSAPSKTLVAFPNQQSALAHPHLDELRSSGTKLSSGSSKPGRDDAPTWPPADGIYWGM